MKWQITTGANAGLVGNVCKAGLSQKLICILFCSDSSGHLQWAAGGCWPVRSAVWRKCSEWCCRCRTVLVSPLLFMIIHCYIYKLIFFSFNNIIWLFCFFYKHNAGWIINTFHLTSDSFSAGPFLGSSMLLYYGRQSGAGHHSPRGVAYTEGGNQTLKTPLNGCAAHVALCLPSWFLVCID